MLPLARESLLHRLLPLGQESVQKLMQTNRRWQAQDDPSPDLHRLVNHLAAAVGIEAEIEHDFFGSHQAAAQVRIDCVHAGYRQFRHSR